MSTKRKNTDYIKNKVKEIFGIDIEVVSDYVNMNTKIKLKCNKVELHGFFDKRPADLIHKKSGCPICTPRGYTFRTLKIKVKEFYGDQLSIVDDEKDIIIRKIKNKKSQKLKVRCVKHGDFDTFPRNLLKGSENPCPECRYELRRTGTNEHIKRLERIHGKKKLLFIEGQDFKGMNKKHKYQCLLNSEHGVFSTTPANIEEGKGCKFCANNQRYTTTQFKKLLAKEHGNSFTLIEGQKYLNSHKKLFFKCNESENHGTFSSKPNSLLTGSGCPYCGRIKSIISRYKGLGLNKESKLILYKILIFNEEECFYKVGITQYDVEKRFRYLYPNFGYKIYVEETKENSLEQIVSLEQNFFISTELVPYTPIQRNRKNNRQLAGYKYETFEVPKTFESIQYYLMGTYDDFEPIIWNLPKSAPKVL